MMEYLWMGIYGFALMFFVTILANILTARFLKRFPDSKPFSFISGFTVTASFLLISILSLPSTLSLQVCFFFLILCSLQFIVLAFTGYKKELSLAGISFLSVFMIPSDMAIFQMLPTYLVYPLLGISLYLIIRVFSIMDKVPTLSKMTVFVQGVLFFFMARTGFFNINISHFIFYAMLIILTVTQLMKLVVGSCILGKYAATATGFILGYCAIYIMAKGFIEVPLLLFSYDLFEILLATGLTFITTHRFYPISVPYLSEQAIATGYLPKKLNRYLLFAFGAIIFAVYVVINQEQLTEAASFLVLFILIAMYMRLKNWGKPKVSFKELKSDLKQGLIQLKEQLNHMPLKKDSVPKKTVKKRGKGSKK